MIKILVMHGPNLGRLGMRETQLYGEETLEQLTERLSRVAEERGAAVEVFQSNHEGALIDRLEEAAGNVQALIINPGGLAHTSVVLRDAVAALGVPAVEVHVTNTYAREFLRHQDLLTPVVVGQIIGLGTSGYVLALAGLLDILRPREPDSPQEGGSH
jgi:3-dehydroquinate dehydratase-2